MNQKQVYTCDVWLDFKKSFEYLVLGPHCKLGFIKLHTGILFRLKSGFRARKNAPSSKICCPLLKYGSNHQTNSFLSILKKKVLFLTLPAQNLDTERSHDEAETNPQSSILFNNLNSMCTSASLTGVNYQSTHQECWSSVISKAGVVRLGSTAKEVSLTVDGCQNYLIVLTFSKQIHNYRNQTQLIYFLVVDPWVRPDMTPSISYNCLWWLILHVGWYVCCLHYQVGLNTR